MEDPRKVGYLFVVTHVQSSLDMEAAEACASAGALVCLCCSQKEGRLQSPADQQLTLTFSLKNSVGTLV
jgi:hypothetical protein